MRLSIHLRFSPSCTCVELGRYKKTLEEGMKRRSYLQTSGSAQVVNRTLWAHKKKKPDRYERKGLCINLQFSQVVHQPSGTSAKWYISQVVHRNNWVRTA